MLGSVHCSRATISSPPRRRRSSALRNRCDHGLDRVSTRQVPRRRVRALDDAAMAAARPRRCGTRAASARAVAGLRWLRDRHGLSRDAEVATRSALTTPTIHTQLGRFRLRSTPCRCRQQWTAASGGAGEAASKAPGGDCTAISSSISCGPINDRRGSSEAHSGRTSQRAIACELGDAAG